MQVPPILIEATRRRATRRRSRLRSGKLVTPDGRFLADCSILDRTDCGACIGLMADAKLPALVWLFDDDTRRLAALRIVWRRGARAGGTTFAEARGDRTRAMRRELCADFYAADG